jgi:predicted RNase H-like HicB family nuclease
MKFKVVFEPSDEGGFTVYVPSLPGCISEGESFEEAMANIKEAIELYLEEEEPLSLSEKAQIVELVL